MLIIDTYRDLMEQERLTEQEKVVVEQWKPVLDELDRMLYDILWQENLWRNLSRKKQTIHIYRRYVLQLAFW